MSVNQVLAGILFREHPWSGVGLGHFRDYPLQAKTILQEHAPSFANRFPNDWFLVPRDPHSTYQGLAAETGILGIGMWCLFLVILVRSLGRAMARTPDAMQRQQLLALLAGIIGFMVQGVYLDILSLRYFWCLVALTSVAIAQADGHHRHGA